MTIVSERLRSNPSRLAAPPRREHPKILHVVTRYLRGGSERRIRDIVEALPEAEHHLVLGGQSDAKLARKEIDPVTLTVVPSLVRQPAPLRDLAALARLAGLIGRNRFDLIVSHQAKAGVLVRVVALTGGVPVVHSLSMANFGPGYSASQSRLFRLIEAKLERATTDYVVVGTDLSRRYAEIGIPVDKLHVVRSGVRIEATSRSDAARSETCRAIGIPADRPLVLSLGSLDTRKNVLDLPRLMRHLLGRAVTPRPFLVVAGEGSMAGRLASAINSSGLADDARLVGFIQDPMPLVAAADAVVLLSSAEGVPQVLVQAAAAGTPFVAYDVDGVRELLDLGAEGVAVPLGDIEGAATATASILGQERAVRACAIDLTSWSPATIGAEYRRVLDAILGGERARTPRSLGARSMP
jgi:glycosyltransferase involved in cell wall biosynthesis